MEEVTGAKTDIVRAELFDRPMNAKLHPNMPMPVYRYYSLREIERLVADVDGEVRFHREILKGNDGTGFLETHLFVLHANQ